MKKDTFKNIIKENLKEKPSALLTAKIMESINVESNEVQLKSLLKEDLTYKPSLNFTNLVLENITEKKDLVIENYSPVISKKAWYFIAATVVLIFALSLNQTESTYHSKYIISSLDFINSKINIFTQYLNSNTFLMMLIVSISGLIFLESIIKSNNFLLKLYK